MIMTDTDILPVTSVKRRFLELLTMLGREGGKVTITRNGVAAGVLVSVDEYESMIETIEILADASVLNALRRSRQNFARGATRTHKQVWGTD